MPKSLAESTGFRANSTDGKYQSNLQTKYLPGSSAYILLQGTVSQDVVQGERRGRGLRGVERKGAGREKEEGIGEEEEGRQGERRGGG